MKNGWDESNGNISGLISPRLLDWLVRLIPLLSSKVLDYLSLSAAFEL